MGDHGCDTFSGTTCAIFCALVFQYGFSLCVFSLSVLHITFFCCQWEELYTGTLRSGVAFLGVTEAQVTIMGLLAASAVFGPGIWQMSVFGWELRFIATAFCILSNVCIGSTCFLSTVSTKAMSILDLFPVGLTILAAYCAQVVVPTGFIAPLRVMSLGNLYAYLSCRMILCAVTHTSYPTLQAIAAILPVLLCFMLEALGVVTSLPPYVDAILFLYVNIMFFRFVIRAAEEICALLNLKVFTIPYKAS